MHCPFRATIENVVNKRRSVTSCFFSSGKRQQDKWTRCVMPYMGVKDASPMFQYCITLKKFLRFQARNSDNAPYWALFERLHRVDPSRCHHLGHVSLYPTTVMGCLFHCTKRNPTSLSLLSLICLGGKTRWSHHDKGLFRAYLNALCKNNL